METDRKKTASEELSRKARLSEWLHDSNQAKDSIPEDTPPLYVALSDPEPSESHQTNHSHLSSDNCDNTSNYGAHPDGLISELFRNSQKAWKLVIDKLAAGLHGTIDFTALQAFRTEAGRFNVWDDGFEAGNGGLGEVLDGAETMKEAVIFLGASIAQKLLRCKILLTSSVAL